MTLMRPEDRVYAVPALEKGLDLLELLSERTDPQSLAELARQLRRSPSEIFRMLQCLERRGYLQKERSGRYRLTLKLYEIAHTHSPVEELLRAADRPMRELAQSLRESCHLSVLRGPRLVVLAQVESPERVRFSVEVGARHPVVHTASGRLLLAHLPSDALGETLAQDPDYRALGRARQRRFLRGLLGLRRVSVAVSESETFSGVRDVVVPVGSPRLSLAAALCVPCLKIRGSWRPLGQVKAAAQRCAQAIHRSLGLGVP
jgi:DNA-binding IclR family transcriptional regulator